MAYALLSEQLFRQGKLGEQELPLAHHEFLAFLDRFSFAASSSKRAEVKELEATLQQHKRHSSKHAQLARVLEEEQLLLSCMSSWAARRCAGETQRLERRLRASTA